MNLSKEKSLNLLEKRNHDIKTSASISGQNGNTTGKAQEALNYCVNIVKERDYENYLWAILMPKEIRPRLFSILALNAEVATLRNKIKRNSGIGGINQLTFWRESLETFGQSNPSLLPRQPVMTALKAFANSADLPLFLKLVEARQQTLGDRPFQSVVKLEEHCQMLYGSLIHLHMNSLRSLNQINEGSELKNAENLAINSMACAVGILTLLRATTLLLKDGIILLPSDLTAHHRVDTQMVYREGPNSLRTVVKDLCQISSDHLESSRSQTKRIHPLLRPALLTSGLRADYSLAILRGKGNFNLLDARLHKPHPFAVWTIWWRMLRKIY